MPPTLVEIAATAVAAAAAAQQVAAEAVAAEAQTPSAAATALVTSTAATALLKQAAADAATIAATPANPLEALTDAVEAFSNAYRSRSTAVEGVAQAQSARDALNLRVNAADEAIESSSQNVTSMEATFRTSKTAIHTAIDAIS